MTDHSKSKLKPGTCEIVSIKPLGDDHYEVTTRSNEYDWAVNTVIAVPAARIAKLREAGRALYDG